MEIANIKTIEKFLEQCFRGGPFYAIEGNLMEVRMMTYEECCVVICSTEPENTEIIIKVMKMAGVWPDYRKVFSLDDFSDLALKKAFGFLQSSPWDTSHEVLIREGYSKA